MTRDAYDLERKWKPKVEDIINADCVSGVRQQL